MAMNTEKNRPETLLEAVKYFAAYDNAHALMVQIRWPGGKATENRQLTQHPRARTRIAGSNGAHSRNPSGGASLVLK